MGISLPLGFPPGVGPGAGGGIDYWVGPFFSGDASSPLATPYTTSGAEGRLVLKQNDGAFSVVSSALILPGQTTPTFGDQALTAFTSDGETFHRQTGMALIFDVNLSAVDRWIFGFSDGGQTFGLYIHTVDGLGLYAYSPESLRTVNNAGTKQTVIETPLSPSTLTRCAIVLGAARDFFVIGNKIMWVQPAGTTSDLAAYMDNWDSEGSVALMAGVYLTSPWTTDFGIATVSSPTTTNGQVFAGNADGITEHTITAATGVTQELMIRRTDDNNCIIARADQANSKVHLFSVESGIETELGGAGGAAQTWTDGVSYVIKVHHIGQSVDVYVDDSRKRTTTAATFNTSITGAKVSHAGANFAAWPRTLPRNIMDYAGPAPDG